MSTFTWLCLVLCFFGWVHCRTPQEWKSRVIYQIITDRFSQNTEGGSCSNLHNYCGGTFKGIMNHIDYIQSMGFNAIWISPIPKNYPNSYHGYGLTDLWKVNDHFGTEQDLLDLITECHQRDIWVMLDIVMNHVGPVDLSFSQISPFNQAAHYHSKCQVVDFMNQTQVELCRLFNLPDLDQFHPFVSQQLISWTQQMVTHFQFDGFRVDTTPYVNQKWWQQWKQSETIRDTITMGEVFDGRINYVASYANIVGSTLSYPFYFCLRNAFTQQGSMNQFEQMNKNYLSLFTDPTVLGNFVDNHDNERFLHANSDASLYRNALTMMLFQQGIPIIYYGTEKGFNGGNDPYCREPMFGKFSQDGPYYQFLKTLIAFRQKQLQELNSNPQIQRYATTNFYAFSRGNVFIATTNIGSHGSIPLKYTITYLPDGYKDGTKLCNVLDNSDCVVVQNRKFDVVFTKPEPKVYYPM